MTTAVNADNINYLELLPPVLTAWGKKIYQISKADPIMICYSLISALSSSGAHLTNERRYIAKDGTFLEGPTGLSLIVIAGSGSLKSTTKKMAFHPLEDIINVRMPEFKEKLIRFKNPLKIKHAPTIVDNVIKFDDEDASEPVTPNFLQNNVTIEAVINLYNKGMLSMTLLSDEGGTFVGSRAMSKDSYINTLSAFNTLLSGDNFSKSTIKGGETLLVSRRLTFMMYMQPQIFNEFLNKCGDISDAGFMQRTLIANAKPAVSNTSDDYIADVIDSFTATTKTQNIFEDKTYLNYKLLISELLTKSHKLDDNGLLSPPTIEPSLEAKCIWFRFYIEQKKIINDNAAFGDDALNSFRERAPENVSRLATLFQLAENNGDLNTPVSDVNMQNAITFVMLSLKEQTKLYDIKDAFFELADILTEWYARRDKQNKPTRMKLRKLIQLVPRKLRNKNLLMQTLEYLTQEGFITQANGEYIYTGKNIK